MTKLLGLFSLVLLFSCSNTQKKVTETMALPLSSGIVFYDIDLSETEDIDALRFGNQATATFNAENLLFQKKSNGVAQENFALVDLKTGVETGHLEFRGNKYAIETDTSMIPKIGNLVYQKDTKIIAGYLCQKAVAPMGDGQLVVWLTKEIGVNYCPYIQPDGFALEYQLTMPFGNIKYSASKVELKSIPKEIFKVSPDYKKVTVAELQSELMGATMESSFKKGATLENFSWEDMEGNRVELEKLKGKVVLLNFWFINCQPCRMEIPDLNELKTEYAGKEIEFVAITFDPKENVKSFLEKSNFDFRIIPNAGGTIETYGIRVFPTSVVLDKNGVIVDSKTGGSMNIKEELTVFIEEAFSQN